MFRLLSFAAVSLLLAPNPGMAQSYRGAGPPYGGTLFPHAGLHSYGRGLHPYAGGVWSFGHLPLSGSGLYPFGPLHYYGMRHHPSVGGFHSGNLAWQRDFYPCVPQQRHTLSRQHPYQHQSFSHAYVPYQSFANPYAPYQMQQRPYALVYSPTIHYAPNFYYPSYSFPSYSSPSIISQSVYSPVMPQPASPPPPPQPYYPPNTRAVAMTTDGVARIDIWTPATARIWCDGVLVSETGLLREFVTPPLPAGLAYAYEIYAEWNREGRNLSQTRRIVVRAGDWVKLDFTRDGWVPASF